MEEHNSRIVIFVAGLPVVSVINRFELAHVQFTPMKMVLEMRSVEEVSRWPKYLSRGGTWTPED